MLRVATALAILIGALPTSAADAIRLGLPVECKMGTVCFIQQYVDQDPSSGKTDYRCKSLSYDGHKGTDFRVRDYVDMQRGVAVVAASDGIVRATRDGMPDVSVREVGVSALLGNDAGNGVLIDHEDGWLTQYSHLRRGSIAVKQGEQVKRGQRLGLIGLSGKTEFPHLDLAVRFNGKVIDPFTGLAAPGGCESKATPLWREDILAIVRYMPSAVLAAGFADHQLPRERPNTDYIRARLSQRRQQHWCFGLRSWARRRATKRNSAFSDRTAQSYLRRWKRSKGRRRFAIVSAGSNARDRSFRLAAMSGSIGLEAVSKGVEWPVSM